MPTEPAHDDDGWKIRRQLLDEADAMASYALSSEKNVPADLVRGLEVCEIAASTGRAVNDITITSMGSPTRPRNETEMLATVHARLKRIVEPATPRAILLMQEERRKNRPFPFLGFLPIVRHLMLVAIVSLVLFVALALSPSINQDDAAAGDIFQSQGMALLINLLFDLAAAGLGASFAALFRVNRFIVTGTFDPKYDTSYWIRLLLGVIAGLILATVVPLEDASSHLRNIARPTLAMLGGFSSDVVYRILNRLVATVESLVKGDTEDLLAAQAREQRARTATEIAQTRGRLAAELLRLQNELTGGGDVEAARKAVAELVDQLMPSDPLGGPAETKGSTDGSAS